MSRVLDTPKIEEKELFNSTIEGESFLFEYFFNCCRPPDGLTEEGYMKELKQEYNKLKREEARRLIGLDKK